MFCLHDNGCLVFRVSFRSADWLHAESHCDYFSRNWIFLSKSQHFRASYPDLNWWQTILRSSYACWNNCNIHFCDDGLDDEKVNQQWRLSYSLSPRYRYYFPDVRRDVWRSFWGTFQPCNCSLSDPLERFCRSDGPDLCGCLITSVLCYLLSICSYHRCCCCRYNL